MRTPRHGPRAELLRRGLRGLLRQLRIPRARRRAPIHELYRALLDDLVFEVIDQVAEDDRVANRWVLTGTNRGRRIRVGGITISRLRDGRIVEDWTGFDGLALVRQLGVARTVLAAPVLLRATRAARRS